MVISGNFFNTSKLSVTLDAPKIPIPDQLLQNFKKIALSSLNSVSNWTRQLTIMLPSKITQLFPDIDMTLLPQNYFGKNCTGLCNFSVLEITTWCTCNGTGNDKCHSKCASTNLRRNMWDMPDPAAGQYTYKTIFSKNQSWNQIYEHTDENPLRPKKEKRALSNTSVDFDFLTNVIPNGTPINAFRQNTAVDCHLSCLSDSCSCWMFKNSICTIFTNCTGILQNSNEPTFVSFPGNCRPKHVSFLGKSVTKKSTTKNCEESCVAGESGCRCWSFDTVEKNCYLYSECNSVYSEKNVGSFSSCCMC